jgi:hypothetical protein
MSRRGEHGRHARLTTHTWALNDIAVEMFSVEQRKRLRVVSETSPFDVHVLSNFDDSVPGPSMARFAEAVRYRLLLPLAGNDGCL